MFHIKRNVQNVILVNVNEYLSMHVVIYSEPIHKALITSILAHATVKWNILRASVAQLCECIVLYKALFALTAALTVCTELKIEMNAGRQKIFALYTKRRL